MNILNFIVIEGKPQYYGETNDEDAYSFTAQGECYIPLETPVPIIKRGSGCIGIGLVLQLEITKTSTTIIYTVSDISETNAKAYYDLYRNQATASNSEEYNEDTIIPGMMRTATSMPRPKKSDYDIGKRKQNSHKSLLDYDDAYNPPRRW